MRAHTDPLQSWVAFLRFGLVGGLCFVVGMLGVWLLTEHLGLHYLLSTAVAMMSANVLGWLLNRSWTYELQRRRSLPEFMRYALINALAAGASLALLGLLVAVAGMHYLLACALVAIAMAIVNFQLHGRWSLRVRQGDVRSSN